MIDLFFTRIPSVAPPCRDWTCVPIITHLRVLHNIFKCIEHCF